jgi:hypothetical protein
MLLPFQVHEIQKIQSFERDTSDRFQTTFGWLGSNKGTGGKMITLASYLNELEAPVRVESRNWRVVHSTNPVESGFGPLASVQTPVDVQPNPYNFPDVSFDANGSERAGGTTLVVVSTSFELGRWNEALERWAPECSVVCAKQLTDIKRLLPVAQRRDLTKSTFTSERCAEIIRAQDVHVFVVEAGFLANYRATFSGIMWSRIVLNDGLTDDSIFKLFWNMGPTSYPTRFTWLIEALSDEELHRLSHVGRLGTMCERGRFSRSNWLTQLCASGVLPSLVVRTPDMVLQEQSGVVRSLSVQTFEASNLFDMQTEEYKQLLVESRLLNASYWVQLSHASISALENTTCWSAIIRKAYGDAVRVRDAVDPIECSVCLEMDHARMPCGHGLCRQCFARVVLRNLSHASCPLCRDLITTYELQADIYQHDIATYEARIGRIRAENDAHLAQFTGNMLGGIQTTIQTILSESVQNQVLLICLASFDHQKLIETNIPSTPLHLTLQGPPSYNERVYYCSNHLYVTSMFKRHPFELSDVTHVLVVDTKDEDSTDFHDLMGMLRVWSLGRTQKHLHYIFFKPT